jgi:hypothetical protein
MVIGHAAGTAAALFALNKASTVQDIEPNELTAALKSEGQILQPPGCD